jgi:hypothetical protein
MSLCFKLNSTSYKLSYYEINRPKYKQPFYVKSIESKTSRNFVIPFIINNDFDNNLIAESFKPGLFEKFKSNIFKLIRFYKQLFSFIDFIHFYVS